jgi:hypothetical protein
MVGIISIKIKEERAKEAKEQNLQRDGTITEGRRSSNRRRWQSGFGEVVKTTFAQEEALFYPCCEQWQGENVLAGKIKIERDREQIVKV